MIWHDEDRLEIHPHDAENRGIRDGDWVRLASRAGETTLRALITDRVATGRGLHDLPPPGHAGQRHHHRLFGLGDQLPRIQGDGGAGSPSNGPTGWQKEYNEQARQSRRIEGRLEAAE